jgi:hypothetical protein
MGKTSLLAVGMASVIGMGVATVGSIALAPLADSLGLIVPGWVGAGLLGVLAGWIALSAAPQYPE